MYLKEFKKSISVVLHDIAIELLAVAGGIALIAIIISGIYFITSRGVPDSRNKAKKMLQYALMGLMLVVLSYSLLVVIERIAV